MASPFSYYALVLGCMLGVCNATYTYQEPQASNQISPFNTLANNNVGGRRQVAIDGGRRRQVATRGGGGREEIRRGDERYKSNEAFYRDKDPIARLAITIPGGGVPGVDYPILASVPDTGFSCADHQPGYYADSDQEARCQVFYICQAGRQDPFLCPNGTIFNQQHFVCEWWFNVDCSSANNFFDLNNEIGKVQSHGHDSTFESASTLQKSYAETENDDEVGKTLLSKHSEESSSNKNNRKVKSGNLYAGYGRTKKTAKVKKPVNGLYQFPEESSTDILVPFDKLVIL